MRGFVRHLILRENFKEKNLEYAKEKLCIITDDGNIKYEVKRINDYNLVYEFYATKSQIDISGYAFKMTSKDRNVEIKISYNDEDLFEYFERKSFFNDKLFIEVLVDMPTRCRKEFKIL